MFLMNVFTLISVPRSKPLELNLNSLAQEVHRGMERSKGSFRPFTEESKSMLNGAGLQGQLRDKIWPECVMTATYLSNVISAKLSLKFP